MAFRTLLAAAVAVAAIVALATTLPTVHAEATAQCWFTPGSAVTGTLTLTQSAAGASVTVAGDLTATAGTAYEIHARNYGDLLDGANLGGCFVDAAIHSFNPAATVEAITFSSSAISLIGSSSLVGRAFAVYETSGGCVASVGTAPVAQCVIGVGSLPAWPDNEAVQGVGSLATAVAALHNPAGEVIGWTQFANNLAGLSLPEVVVSIKVWGMVPNSVHSVHVHWYGNMSAADGSTVGGHHNPDGRRHGLPPSWQRHAGDIGTVNADTNGNITFFGSFNKLTLNGFGNIIGRGVVLHALGDDGNPDNTTDSTGAAGARIARGVVGISARRPADLNPAYATCTFTPGQAITGQLLLQQVRTGANTRIYGSLTGVTASGALNLFVNTYGDIATTSNGGACWNSRTAPMASWTSVIGSATEIDATVLLNTVSLFGDNVDNAIIGRVLTVSTASTCAEAASAVTAQCVVGIASASALLNPAIQSLNSNPVGAHCQLAAGTGAPTGFAGEIHFSPVSGSDEVYVYTYARGLVANSVHSVHVHWYGDLLLADGTGAGGHLNPSGKNHGWAPSTERHRGDIGNYTADSNGIIQEGRNYNLLNFIGAGNIIGRGCIFHAQRDDGNPANTTASTGDAGARWGRGVIGISSRAAPTFPFPASSSAMPSSSAMGSSGMTGTGAAASSTGKQESGAAAVAVPAVALFATVLAAALL